MIIKSPITISGNVRKVDEIKTEDVISSYEEIGVDKYVREYLSGINKIDIYKCCDTGYRFYYPFTIFGKSDFYSCLQTKRKYYADWRWEYDIVYEKIKPGQKILEIGCGAGNFIKKARDDKKCHCFGLEFNKKAILESRKKGLNVESESIEQHSRNNNLSYDIVCFFHVLEHISKPRGFLTEAISCLKKGGLLAISVPNNNPYYYQNSRVHALNLPPHHAGLWDKKSLSKLENIFDIKLEYIKAEPLFNEDFFWNVKMNYWRNNRKFIYFLASLLPGYINKTRNVFLRRFCDGCNLLALYSKK